MREDECRDDRRDFIVTPAGHLAHGPLERLLIARNLRQCMTDAQFDLPAVDERAEDPNSTRDERCPVYAIDHLEHIRNTPTATKIETFLHRIVDVVDDDELASNA